MFLVPFLSGNINTILIVLKTIKLSAIDSTNDYLKAARRSQETRADLLVVAENQTQGRGQHGSTWHSEPGKSLTFSMLRYFSQLTAERSFSINFAVSLGLYSALDRMKIPEISIKWPNDIMAGSTKLCGILIENQLLGNKLNSSIIGVGINVNNDVFPSLNRASSLYLQTGRQFELEQVLSDVATSMASELGRLDRGEHEALQEEYETKLFRNGVLSTFKNKAGKSFEGTIRGVTKHGNLKVDSFAGKKYEFGLKELELLY